MPENDPFRAEVLKRFEPNSKAKYGEFTTLVDPDRFPGQRPVGDPLFRRSDGVVRVQIHPSC